MEEDPGPIYFVGFQGRSYPTNLQTGQHDVYVCLLDVSKQPTLVTAYGDQGIIAVPRLGARGQHGNTYYTYIYTRAK